ncbi:MAG: hypothetical protein AABX59_04090 [Nanoarchaeota archaeon]
MEKTQRIIVAVLLGIVAYLILTAIFSVISQPRNMYDMMRFMHGGAYGGFYNTLNLISIVLSVGVGILIYYLIPESKVAERKQDRYRKEDRLKILMRVLSDDEKKALKEIEKEKSITQDSLRFRLGWSKAKISAVVSRLDKARIIQRKREGKTYKVFLRRKR